MLQLSKTTKPTANLRKCLLNLTTNKQSSNVSFPNKQSSLPQFPKGLFGLYTCDRKMIHMNKACTCDSFSYGIETHGNTFHCLSFLHVNLNESDGSPFFSKSTMNQDMTSSIDSLAVFSVIRGTTKV